MNPISFSNSFSPWNSCYATPAPQAAPQATEQVPEQAEDQTLGAAGFAADSSHDLAEFAGNAWNSAASEMQPVADSLKQTASDLGGSIGRDLNDLGDAVQGAVGDLHSAGEAAESAAKTLGHAGKALGLADAAEGAYATYNKSDAQTVPGKLTDAALAGGSKLLAGAALPIAAADTVTGGEVSNLYHAGGKAIGAGIQSLISGNPEAVQKFNAASARGDYGVVSQAVTRSGLYMRNEVIPQAVHDMESWF